jgi:diguanylate cyclase (GGDEF)-like protein
LSGDEFALLIGADPAGALTAAWSAWHAIASHPVAIAGQPRPVWASIGLASRHPGTTGAQLLHQADLAMYHAKAAGTGVYTHHPGMPDRPSAGRPALRQRDLPRPRPISPPPRRTT